MKRIPLYADPITILSEWQPSFVATAPLYGTILAPDSAEVIDYGGTTVLAIPDHGRTDRLAAWDAYFAAQRGEFGLTWEPCP